MTILDYFLKRRKTSATVAKERLQIILARENAEKGSPDYLPALKQDILKVVEKYVAVDYSQIQVTLENDGDLEILELNISIPESQHEKKQAARR